MRVTRAYVLDAVLAVLLTWFSVVGTVFAYRNGAAGTPLDGVCVALVAAAPLILVVRRRWPGVVLLASALIISSYLIIGYAYGPIFASLLVAVYSAARHLPPARSIPFSLVALVILVVHILFSPNALPGAYGLIPGSAWVVVPFALGLTVRVSKESAGRARAETIRRLVDDERLRVAQEVHDIVGHGLAAIKMQADIALHLLERKPDQARTALDAISRSSSAALEELRATLAVVRRGGDEADERSSGPRLIRLEELAERMREAGLEVETRTTGEPRELPAIVDLTGYRIVQESLTNVLRHSGSRHAEVSLGYESDALHIRVTNRVAGAPGRAGGLGIPGMRERVAALGGQFSAGPLAGNIFEVRASIPTGGHQ